METTFNEAVYLQLTEENQIKVEHIYILASIFKEHGIRKLSTAEFDELYDKSLEDLELLTSYTEKRFNAEWE